MNLPFHIAICRRDECGWKAASIGAQHMISILDPGIHVLRPPGISPERHLWLTCFDTEDSGVRGAPRRRHIKELLSFARRIPEGEILLVHCEGGISRSTAAAFLIIAQAIGVEGAEDALNAVYKMRPLAMPNRLMISHGDRELGAAGKLIELVERVRAEKEDC